MSITGTDLITALEAIGFDVRFDAAVADRLAGEIQRVNDWQKDEYDGSWGRMRARMTAAMAETGDVLDVVGRLEGATTSTNGINKVVLNVGNPPRVEQRRFPDPPESEVIVVKDGRYVLTRYRHGESRLYDDVLAHVTESTEAIVELGCGWGRNLARLAAREDRTRGLDLIGAEQSPEGRECTSDLLGLARRSGVKTVPFDYYDPDFAAIADYRDIVVYSYAAIEQITFLPRRFLEEFTRQYRGRYRFVFYEPFSWQMDARLQIPIINKLFALIAAGESYSSVMRDHLFKIEDGRIDLNAAVWALGCCYNMNLYSLIQSCRQDGLIDVLAIDGNVEGNNLFNPYGRAVIANPAT